MSMLLAGMVYGQDTTFYDAQWKKKAGRQASEYYSLVDSNNLDKIKRSYTVLGKLISEIHLDNRGVRNGTSKTWYPSGQLKSSAYYIAGKVDGQVLTYWEGGELKRSDTYQAGELVSSHIQDPDGKELAYYPFEVMPEFPGGINKFVEYLQQNVRYPKAARDKEIEGKVFISFFIEATGDVTDVTVAKGASPLLDAEAIRVVSQMPKWKPHQTDGENMGMYFNVPINFSLRY